MKARPSRTPPRLAGLESLRRAEQPLVTSLTIFFLNFQVSRSRIDSSALSSAEVEVRVRELRAAGTSPVVIDEDWLARTQPGLVLTQDSCSACDADYRTVAEALRRSGAPQPNIVSLSPRTISDVMDSILEVRAGRRMF